jgi:hypothetical protein
MYIDAQNLFSDAQAVTADAVGTNVIDLTIDRSIGNGEPMLQQTRLPAMKTIPSTSSMPRMPRKPLHVN